MRSIAGARACKTGKESQVTHNDQPTRVSGSAGTNAPSTQLIVSFKHYEHQGIDLKLVSTVGGGMLLQVARGDNSNVLLKVELPKNTKLFDRRS